MNPLLSLFVAALVVLGACLLLWPDRGLLQRWRDWRRLSDRILLEDALKHLYNSEYRGRAPTLNSLSGVLQVPSDRAARLLIQLESTGMVKSTEESLGLTPEGRDYALRILRVHRLWEHYLAEETGVDADQLHRQAEHREHLITDDEADQLDTRLGFPVYDPHGDPIPTAAGEIAPQRGRSLTSLRVGEMATVVHVEDEPEEMYAQLSAHGLIPGMAVQITEVADEHVRFMADGEIISLPPLVAGNILVVPKAVDEEMGGPYETLSALGDSESASVVRIAPTCRGLERRRLLDLGILPGTSVEREMRSPGGDPTAYRIRGALIALRREQADHIQIERELEVSP